MHDNAGNLCSYCYAKEVKRQKKIKPVLKDHQEKYAKFIGGEPV